MNGTTFATALLCLSITACPGQDPTSTDDGSSGNSGDTTQATATVASGDPTDQTSTGDTPTTGEDPTTGGDSTGGPVGSVSRVIYYPLVEILEQPNASALRYVEITDGVPAPPVTVLDPPGEVLITQDATPDRRWSPYYTGRNVTPQLWLVDMVNLVPHEAPLPPEVEQILSARLSRDDGYLIVHGGPLKSAEEGDYRFYVCEIGDEGDCALQLIEPATGPDTYVTSVDEVSKQSGRIWYMTKEIGGPGTAVLAGDFADPELADPLIEFPDDALVVSFVSKDETTLVLVGPGDNRVMDISVDPPGPVVPIHPPLPGMVRLTWSSDEKRVLVLNSEGKFGDLYLVELDGASVGPMQTFNSDAPGHVEARSAAWTADASKVLLLSDHETPMFSQLYLADPADPAAAPIRLNGALEPTGEVNAAFQRGDPNHVVYFAQSNDKTPNEIYRARLDPPGEAHKLNGPLADGTFLLDGAFDESADGTRLVYAGFEVIERSDLFLVEFDGEQPAPPVNLTSGLPPGTEVNLLGRLSPDANQAFFAGRGPDNERLGLYMVPLAPVAAPLQISDDGEGVYDYDVLTLP